MEFFASLKADYTVSAIVEFMSIFSCEVSRFVETNSGHQKMTERSKTATFSYLTYFWNLYR